MRTITFDEVGSRRRFTERGLMLLDIVRNDPGIDLETLVREHDPPPIPLPESGNAKSRFLSRLRVSDAIRKFPSGGHAVR